MTKVCCTVSSNFIFIVWRLLFYLFIYLYCYKVVSQHLYSTRLHPLSIYSARLCPLHDSSLTFDSLHKRVILCLKYVFPNEVQRPRAMQQLVIEVICKPWFLQQALTFMQRGVDFCIWNITTQTHAIQLITITDTTLSIHLSFVSSTNKLIFLNQNILWTFHSQRHDPNKYLWMSETFLHIIQLVHLSTFLF